ncbi:MAG: hypothetical protein HFI91_03990 [Lachnospiraceae bacterium]|jgi:hypothetical protein|nr:hypothetical protein [Lachnospiraceae bacterium]
MFKEAFAGILALFLFFLIYRRLWKKRKATAAALLFCMLIFFSAANCIYNGLVMFPDFYMDTVNGPFRYGTFSGNLFAYSDEFMFQDEILFPILKNRHVSLDSQAGFYEKFVSLYAKTYEQIEITDETRKTVRSHREAFDFCHPFTCIGIMDYVTDEIPKALVPAFEEEIYPMLYINTDSLKDQSNLVFVMNPDYSVYVMSEAFYREITGEST